MAHNVQSLIDRYRGRLPAGTGAGRYRLDQSDILVIAYPDHIQDDRGEHLRTLGAFLRDRLGPLINSVHLLPFFPYSSDDGFSILDYRAVAPGLGGWEAIRSLGEDYRLMFDAVFNHMSAQSEWMARYLAGDEEYQGFFIECDPHADYSRVTRPRSLPLLTKFDHRKGEVWLWTTFSADQVDLNFADPSVFMRFLELLLFFVEQKASLIRLDAIGFLWKEPGTTCIHLPRTHAIIKLWRLILDEAAPHVTLITETNVPHDENISYFNEGNEAQLVYQFSLPPLVLHALLNQNGTYLRRWAAGLELPAAGMTYFNFTASHDGIGLRPLTGLVPEADIEHLCQLARERGGDVSTKTNSDGSESPYELNVNYLSFLTVPGESEDLTIRRFMCSQSIMLTMPGMPAIYLASLIGAGNWNEGVRRTGAKRSINREKFRLDQITIALGEDSLQARVLSWYRRLLALRKASTALTPEAAFYVHDCGEAVFLLERFNTDTGETLIAAHNLSQTEQTVSFRPHLSPASRLHRLDDDSAVEADNGLFSLTLPPVGHIWLSCLRDADPRFV